MAEAFIEQLTAAAAEQKKKSPGDLARELVIRSLTDKTETESQRRVTELAEQIRVLREDLITTVALVLRIVGEDIDAREARRKAEEIFRAKT